MTSTCGSFCLPFRLRHSTPLPLPSTVQVGGLSFPSPSPFPSLAEPLANPSSGTPRTEEDNRQVEGQIKGESARRSL
ncbi:hypothetical protein E2C01_088629 [Portunus trituberculatus]|uniref:Uncharacterized protein n=1 Tax=Portunus trituberculatus TaxID=210409 RepID=A0A5B7JF64_PORTR|nr:hypothetical protein [Portunus trituberculatus]